MMADPHHRSPHSHDHCGRKFMPRRTFFQQYNFNIEEEDEDDDDAEDGGPEVGRGEAAMATQEEDLAKCLVLLSSGRNEPIPEAEESCASADREEKPKGLFECKACKKVFTSHQALGGHRASHKKVKGCFAAKMDEREEEEAAARPLGQPLARKKKMHECSVCHRTFTSGQALGGHKRCHWITTSAGEPARALPLMPLSETLERKLPAPPDDGGGRIVDPVVLQMPPPDMYLATWRENVEIEGARTGSTRIMNKKRSISNVEDEAESSVKVAKTSDLKDLKMGRDDSWLQMGPSSHSNDIGKRE